MSLYGLTPLIGIPTRAPIKEFLKKMKVMTVIWYPWQHKNAFYEGMGFFIILVIPIPLYGTQKKMDLVYLFLVI